MPEKSAHLRAVDVILDNLDPPAQRLGRLDWAMNVEKIARALAAAGLLVNDAARGFEYGYNTGSTVTPIGDITQITSWAQARGMKVGQGDFGSRIVRRVNPGPWEPLDWEKPGEETP